MKNEITVREATTKEEVAFFWEQLAAYFQRDIFPEPGGEERDHFLSSEYRAHMEKIHEREYDRCHYLLLCKDNAAIGFAMAVIFHTEDAKCFLMEFCVFPQFRGNGTGTQCAQIFLSWAKSQGAAYVEINCDTAQRQRFWKRLGFQMNGIDQWGVPLMMLPPEKSQPFSVEILKDGEDWQFQKLENGYHAEIGEGVLTKEMQQRLSGAIFDGKITFFLAKRGYRAVGMCSVATEFSTFTCDAVGVFEDFYIEPVFRKQGIARMLVEAAQRWCKEQKIASLRVTCAPCDEKMYQALGFDVHLGNTYLIQ